MISPKTFAAALSKNGINFFTGVPDSLLKDFCAYIADTAPSASHVIAANEGNAVALAAGHYLATGDIGLVYMQNSGLGNSVNPLVSLADRDVYGIPIILLIGWRGEPGAKDEPQHVKQGKVTLELLRTLGIPHEVLPKTEAGVKKTVGKALAHVRKVKAPYALVVRAATFKHYEPKKKIFKPRTAGIMREEALAIISEEFGREDIVVSTTGKTSRELFELRERRNEGHGKDFLTVGSMGHASQIALGIALAHPNRKVFCLDGDGALIMHMGALAVIGHEAPRNFKHIILNNSAHESVGGQPTAALSMDVCLVAQACGYKKIFRASSKESLQGSMGAFKKARGPAALEVVIQQGSRRDLGRPTTSPKENKELFMDFLYGGSDVLSAAGQLKMFFEKHKAKRIFLVAGHASYKQSGAERMFHRVLSSYIITQFSDFFPNPKLEDIERGIKIFRKTKCDVVVAIGGGSAIDVAKLINILSAQPGLLSSQVRGKKLISNPGKPLVAIPTTAGSGSEATHFAVVYDNGKKYSVAHQFMLPTLAILDPALTMSMSPHQTAVSGIDALAQAIESYWSVNSTNESKYFAAKAINLIVRNLIRSVQEPTREARAAMMRASYSAGRAINIAKTTAPHAISYFFTSHFGIPHGHAVALTLGPVFFYNSHVNSKDVVDARGEKYVRQTMVELEQLLGVGSPAVACRKIQNIMKQIGLETRLSKLGLSHSDVAASVAAVDVERLKNNPRRLDERNITKMLLSLL